MKTYRIGVDVGGTNTDAALMQGTSVVATVKSPTTTNISGGIVSAISEVMKAGGVSPDAIRCVMIGTTHFTNAFVQRRGLQKVGVIRIAAPAARGVPPLIDWPDDFRSTIGSQIFSIRGGYNFDGRLNAELDETALRQAGQSIKDAGISSVALTGLFSPVNAAMEDRASDILQDIIPGVRISLSSRIGRLGLLERENAAVMNASLADMAAEVVSSFDKALESLGILAPYFVSQNDGTLIPAEEVKRYPVLTFASGPTNSMRGAAYLTGLSDAIVADIGGTTTDIGVLSGGFPRESASGTDIGGVRTNFRMPDIYAMGLGGGSIVCQDPLSIGPSSVGYKLLQEARIFGGRTLTASDIVVANGMSDFGNRKAVATLPPELVSGAIDRIHTMIAEGVDRMKTNHDPVPLILVGGGAILVGRDIPGTSVVLKPEHAGTANAIGASIAQIGGQIDHVYNFNQIPRDDALNDAIARAKAKAIDAGASSGSVEIIELEEVPVPYLSEGDVRVRAKAVGDLDLDTL